MTPTDDVRVLMIDDDEEDHLLVEDLLEEADTGFLLDHAYTAAEGLGKLRDGEYAAVLTDYRLGADDGLDLVREADRVGFEGALILLTGQDDFELGRAAIRDGATDYLVKGRFTGDALGRAIRYGIERRTLERRLKSFNAELERRVRERTAELESATRELEGFTYSASHDLRTPLRAIMATSRILVEDHGGKLDDEAKELLNKQAAAAKRLGNLIDDLLEFSRIGRTDVGRVPVDLGEIAAEVAREVHPPVTLTVDGDVIAHGDPRLLRLTIQNLLENTAKFSDPSTTPTARISAAAVDGATEVTYEDDGPGFDQQYEPKIWVPFQRLVRDEDFPGTGIGLANVKRIVDRHGGSIRAEGRPGVGARFVMTLPNA